MMETVYPFSQNTYRIDEAGNKVLRPRNRSERRRLLKRGTHKPNNRTTTPGRMRQVIHRRPTAY